MTSHYARCLVRNSFESVFDALNQGFGNIHARRLSRPGQPQAAIILGEKYFFRNESDAAVSIILEQHSSGETGIEIISYAGASGLLGISYSAHTDYVHDVVDFLSRSGFTVEVEQEIPHFERSH